MEIIAELEPSRRGVYCGSIGYSAVTGAMDTSIVIRTFGAPDGRVYFQAGGGIVADSDPELEYRETLDKARALIEALASDPMILLHRQLRLVRLQPGPLRPRAGRGAGRCGGTTRSRSTDVAALAPSHIIISPGPCSPAEAGISTDVVRRLGATMPILGVCLGHQCIGAAYGGEIVRAGRPMHGKTSLIHHRRRRASSLACRRRSARRATTRWSSRRPRCPTELEVTATSEDGEIMAVRHRRIRSTACSSIPSRCSPSTATACSITSCTASPASPPGGAARRPTARSVPADPDPGTLASEPPLGGPGAVIIESIVTSMAPDGAINFAPDGRRVGRGRASSSSPSSRRRRSGTCARPAWRWST